MPAPFRPILSMVLVAFAAPGLSLPATGQVVETLSIGALDGPPEYTFADVAGVAADDRGRIYVLDRGERTVRVFNADGEHVGNLGRPGSGPGEFRDPRQLALAGDSVAVYDTRLKRLTLFDRDGRLVDTWEVPVASWFANGVAGLGDGSFLIGVNAGTSIPPQPEREGKSWIIRFAEDGVRDTLLVTRGPDDLVERTQDRLLGARMPFGRRPRWSVAPDGRIAFGRGETYTISIYSYRANSRGESGTARVIDTIERDIPNPPVTDQDVEAYRATYLENDRFTANVRRAYRRLLDEATYPDTWSAFHTLLYDDSGRLWVERPRTAAQSVTRWQVLDTRGRQIATVTMDDPADIHAIVGSSMYGVIRDELDVPYVKRYEHDVP